MTYATEKLARFAATLRAGRIVEFVNETPDGRVVRSMTRFRIGPDRIDGSNSFQIETKVTNRRDRTATSPFSYCDWTAQDIYDLLNEYPEVEPQLISAEEAAGDEIAQQLIKASYKPVSFGAYSFEYHPEDDALLVCGGVGVGDVPMKKPHHSFEDIVLRGRP